VSRFSIDQRDRLAGALILTGETLPVGGELKAKCFKLSSSEVTPALREIVSEVCANRDSHTTLLAKVEALEKRIEAAEAHTHEPEVYVRLIDLSANGPSSGDMETDSLSHLFYWDKDFLPGTHPTGRWVSVETHTVGWGWNANGVNNFLKSAGNVFRAGTGFRGIKFPYDFRMTAWAGSCDNSSGPVSTEVELWIDDGKRRTISWPDNTTSWSESLSGANMPVSNSDGAHNVKVTASVAPNTLPNKPRVQTYWKMIYNDGVYPWNM
tara:strand:+ start:324 stop:1121 length:798 start_codon:yes stop_codon:yes gene_type:complete